MKDLIISRRTMLRGTGAAIALPWLESMLAPSAYAAPGKAPLRAIFMSVPNGKHMQDWTPAGDGSAWAVPYIMEPVAHLKSDLLVLTGLTHDKARANGDGPGDHARSAGTFLTAMQAKKTAGADIRLGVSVDQVAAQKIGKATRFPSLELGIERGQVAGNCDSGYSCAYSSNISWKSESTPMPKETSPRSLFERLFGEGGGKPADTGAKPGSRELYKRSILDYVLEDAGRLAGKLPAGDKRKLDEYLSAIREIENRIVAAERSADGPSPGTLTAPTGDPRDYQDHCRLMFDLLTLALQTDSTRIATFMFANEGSNRAYSMIGVTEGHHDLSHHGGDKNKHEKIKAVNRYHVSQLGYFLDKLKAVREGAGTLLDSTLVLYGSGISDGDRHNHDNLPVLLAGKLGGAIHPGRHVRFPRNTPMADLFLSILDRLGASVPSFGDSKGRLPAL
jgi:hypothetical protein